MSTDVETATAGVGETRPEAAAGDLALLERHKPLLRFDRQYDYRLASVLGMVENPGNLLRTADGEVIARVGGDPPLTLELLSAYPDGREPSSGDCICQAPDVLGDARRMEYQAQYGGGSTAGWCAATAGATGFSTGSGSTTTRRTSSGSASTRATGR